MRRSNTNWRDILFGPQMISLLWRTLSVFVVTFVAFTLLVSLGCANKNEVAHTGPTQKISFKKKVPTAKSEKSCQNKEGESQSGCE